MNTTIYPEHTVSETVIRFRVCRLIKDICPTDGPSFALFDIGEAVADARYDDARKWADELRYQFPVIGMVAAGLVYAAQVHDNGDAQTAREQIESELRWLAYMKAKFPKWNRNARFPVHTSFAQFVDDNT